VAAQAYIFTRDCLATSAPVPPDDLLFCWGSGGYPPGECSSAESAAVEAPLTSEPPLPAAEPLTSEPPLADAEAMTSEHADAEADPTGLYEGPVPALSELAGL